MNKIYGAYGSNMNTIQMARRCPSAKVISTGHIKNYRLTFRGSGNGVANIEYYRGGRVPVVIWDITRCCETALDRYEGYPSLYVKKNIPIHTDDGETISAMFYVMGQGYEQMPAPPSKQYIDTIWSGYKQNNIPLRTLREAIAQNQNELEELPNKSPCYPNSYRL